MLGILLNSGYGEYLMKLIEKIIFSNMIIENLFCKDGKLIEGLKLITHEVLYDERGFFVENWNKLKFEKVIGDSLNFFQLNQSRSLKGFKRFAFSIRTRISR